MSTEFADDNDLLDSEEELNLEPPPLYKVVLVNDDFTPMDFVVQVLEKIFHHKHEAANQIMLAVHQHGKGVAGVFTHEIAETKQAQAMMLAKQEEHPLMCVLEQA